MHVIISNANFTGTLHINSEYVFSDTYKHGHAAANSMDPKHAVSQGAEAPTPKRQRRVLSLEEKVKMLDLLQEGMSTTSVGRRHGVNESTVRCIKKNEAKIRDSFHVAARSSGKYTSYLRDRDLVKMENALSLWIQDQHRKGNPIDNNIIRSKAKSLYNNVKTTSNPDAPSTSTDPGPSPSTFTASKGGPWVEILCEISIYAEVCGP